MGYFDSVNRDILARAGLSARPVLVLGCGTGALGAALALPGAPARLTAIHAPDPADRMGTAIRWLPFLDYPDHRREMLVADVALCPLAAGGFNACKSDLKIVECLAHGTVPLLPTHAAAQTDVPGGHRLVVATARDWVDHLRRLAARTAAGLDRVIRNRMRHGHVAAPGLGGRR